ncbi:MAG: hypothetical protein J0L72_10710 [Armatimonadetes bacterium]|nr:hypothetical protein [Armatimonadota bacterium]
MSTLITLVQFTDGLGVLGVANRADAVVAVRFIVTVFACEGHISAFSPVPYALFDVRSCASWATARFDVLMEKLIQSLL